MPELDSVEISHPRLATILALYPIVGPPLYPRVDGKSILHPRFSREYSFEITEYVRKYYPSVLGHFRYGTAVPCTPRKSAFDGLCIRLRTSQGGSTRLLLVVPGE